MAFDPKAIANFFVRCAADERKQLTPLQAIKLVFIAHGWYLGLTEKPLVSEPPQAWKYGPVFPSLYQEFRGYGDGPITSPATTFTADYSLEIVPPPSRSEQEPLCKFLEQVYAQYGKFSGTQLSTLTHQEGSPWYKAWHELGGKHKKNFPIPQDLITEYYKQLRVRNAQSRRS